MLSTTYVQEKTAWEWHGADSNDEWDIASKNNELFYSPAYFHFFVKSTDRKAKGEECKALKKITAKVPKAKRTAGFMKMKLENLGRNGPWTGHSVIQVYNKSKKTLMVQ